MSYLLKKLNVVRQVDTKEEAELLEAVGFTVVSQPSESDTEPTLAQLKASAKEKGIPGYGKMKYEELLAALSDLDDLNKD